MNIAWESFKLLAGSLAVASSQSLLSIAPGSSYGLNDGDGQGNCNVSSAFGDATVFSSLKVSESPYTTYLQAKGSAIESYAPGDMVYNGGAESLILNFNKTCTPSQQNGFHPTSYGAGLCFEISSKAPVNCTLYQAPSFSYQSKPTVRLLTKGYTPNSQGFPADSIIELSQDKPFNAVFSSDIDSIMEVIGVADSDTPVSSEGLVFMSCLQSKNNETRAPMLAA